MRAIRHCGIIVMVVVGTSNVAHAQVMLVGCTAFLATNPQSSNLVDVDPFTGACTNARNIGIRVMGGIATHPATGELFGLTTFSSTPVSSLVRIDVSTGNATIVGPTGLPQLVEGDLAFNPINGFLYGVQDDGASGTQRNLFRINPMNGAATLVGNIGGAADYSALAFNSAGTLFTIDSAGSGNSLLEVLDSNTAAILSTITMNVNLGPAAALTLHPFTGAAYVADGGGSGATNLLYSLDLGTGILSAIGPTVVPDGLAGLSFVSVPEPSSLLLLSIAAVALRKRLRCRADVVA
jgi:PEP-CTERM motif